MISVLGVFLFVLSLFTICNNLLLLDDFHPLYSSLTTDETTLESMQGHFIYINLDSLILSLYKDGSLIRTYPVSGGKTNTPSPTGTWKIITKSTWGEGFGGSWLGLNVPWGTLILDTF